MPPIILAIIPFIEAAIKFAPDATKIYEDARNLFAMWFHGGLITIEQQDRLLDWTDNMKPQHLAASHPRSSPLKPTLINGLRPRANPRNNWSVVRAAGRVDRKQWRKMKREIEAKQDWGTGD